jgi:hypothetical protein
MFRGRQGRFHDRDFGFRNFDGEFVELVGAALAALDPEFRVRCKAFTDTLN